MQIPLSSTFFNPGLVYVPGQLDRFLVGLGSQPRQQADNIFSKQLTQHLFQVTNPLANSMVMVVLQPTNGSYGMDLVALNIQRGRDHGTVLEWVCAALHCCRAGGLHGLAGAVRAGQGRDLAAAQPRHPTGDRPAAAAPLHRHPGHRPLRGRGTKDCMTAYIRR